MCLEDIRIGRLTKTYGQTFSLTSAQTKTIQPNLQRVQLCISIAAGTITTTQLESVVFDNGAGLGMSVGAPNLILSVANNYDLVMRGFTITCASTALVFYVTETVLPESALEEALEWLNQPYKARPRSR
jgi:hypothetical protein